MILDRRQKIVIYVFIFFFIYYAVLSVLHITEGFYNDLYGLLLGVVVLASGVISMVYYHEQYQNTNSKTILKGLFILGLGLFCWGIGTIVWIYYSMVFGIVLAYPSIADIFYLPSVVLYCTGIFLLLSQNFQKKFKDKNEIIRIITICIFISIVTFYMMVTIVRGGKIYDSEVSLLTNILNILYPCFDFVGLILAFFISGITMSNLKSKYGKLLFILAIGLVLMFISDSLLAYFTLNNFYYNGGFTDFLFTVSTLTIIFSLMGLCSKDSEFINN